MTKTLELANLIEAIDTELASGFPFLRFGPDTERQFEQDVAPTRRRHLAIASLLGVILYDLFLYNDNMMVPDVFSWAVIYRLGIFTPISLVGIMLLRTRLRMRWLELYGVFAGVLAVGLIMMLYVQSVSPYKSIYQYGTVIIMIFVAVVQRLSFRFCLLSISLMYGLQVLGLTCFGEMDTTTREAALTFYACTGVLVLFTAYGLEREFRLSYLLRSRGRILNEKLDHVAKIDPLTGLFNRRHLNEIMAAAWAKSRSQPCTMAVILLDIDHFKALNDTHGHLAGDECLCRLSACIRSAVGDVAIRFGGEEFLIFLENIASDEPHNIANRLRAAIAAEAIPHPALGEGSVVTASIGIGIVDVSASTPSNLLAVADKALYAAKAAGRDCIRPAQVQRPFILVADDAA